MAQQLVHVVQAILDLHNHAVQSASAVLSVNYNWLALNADAVILAKTRVVETRDAK